LVPRHNKREAEQGGVLKSGKKNNCLPRVPAVDEDASVKRSEAINYPEITSTKIVCVPEVLVSAAALPANEW
jgi:hypothetical protein